MTVVFEVVVVDGCGKIEQKEVTGSRSCCQRESGWSDNEVVAREFLGASHVGVSRNPSRLAGKSFVIVNGWSWSLSRILRQVK